MKKNIVLGVEVVILYDDHSEEREVILRGQDYNTFEFLEEHFKGNDKVVMKWSEPNWRVILKE